MIVSTWTSLRLLSVWSRTRQLPELLIGLGLLGTGPFGFGLSIVAELMPSEGASALVRLVGIVTVSLACLAFYGFTAKVFRPGATWARLFTGMAAVVFAVLFGLSLQDHWTHGADRIDPYVLPRSIVLGIGWAWMGIECLRYWGLTRRRAALGLADPVVANRFFLWGVVSIESVVNVTSSTVLAIRDAGTVSEFSVLLGGVLGLIGSVALLLAFLPPARYTDWIRARAQAASRSS
jgi:hypothetical protein